MQPEGHHQMGQVESPYISVEEVLERMKKATGTEPMLELSTWLNVRQSCYPAPSVGVLSPQHGYGR